jgi:hypothetical protein
VAGTSAARIDIVLAVLVALVAAGFAGVMLADYYANPDPLWREFYHDRNGHFSFGLNLALALRDLDPIAFFDHLEKAKVWPPVHGLVLAAVLLVGGVDYRLGIVPSLIGWSTTIVFCWLIARQAFHDRLLGIFAGCVAITFALASPTFRRLGADVMLEGLGAGLSAFAVWAYIAARRSNDSAAAWRVLAIVLTVLFFEKSNYYFLIAAPLALAAFCERPRFWIDEARGLLRRASVPSLAGKAVRDPLLLAAAAVIGVVIYLHWRGPGAVVVFGRSLSLYPPHNLVTVAYALLFVRAAMAWREHRAAIMPGLGVAGRELFYWHVVPLLVSFLLPRRLAVLLWYVGPVHYQDAQGGYDLAHALQTYGPAFREGFHVAPWAALFAVALFAAGAIQLRRLEPAVRSVFVVAVLALTVVFVHPQHQARFLTTPLFALWAGAGIGAALLLERIGASRIARAAIAAVVVVALAVGSTVQPLSARAAAFAIQARAGPSDVDMVRPWLATVETRRPIMVATTFGSSTLFEWVIQSDCRCRRRVLPSWILGLPSREAVRAAMAERVAATDAEYLVVIDAPASRYQLARMGWSYKNMAGILDAMAAQDRFARVADFPLPQHGGEAVVWRRR